MIKAISRYIRAVGYLLTGRIDSARKALSTNPYVVQATYDNIISEKTARIRQYKEAVAAMIAQEEKKVAKIRSLTEDIEKLERLREGAAAKARQAVERLRASGASEAEMKADGEYLRCSSAFKDFSSTLAEKQQHVEELEGEIGGLSSNINNHKVQLQSLLREIDKLKEEQSAAVADMITGKQEAEIADMLSGISADGTAKELQEMRELRQQVKAEARISREMAGTDTKVQENEFLEYARTSQSDDEFDRLIGLAEETDRTETPGSEDGPIKLPES